MQKKQKQFLWIVSFQYQAAGGIKAYATCVEETSLRMALADAEFRTKQFADENGCIGRTVITDIGIGDEEARDNLGRFWPDPINDPDPELFA